MTSSALYPNMRSAAGFQLVITPSGVLQIMASSDELIMDVRKNICDLSSLLQKTIQENECLV